MYKDFTDMPVWIKGMDYATSVFNLSSNLPKQEDYALTSQIRRAALSITDNIAEAFGRDTMKDKRHFYVISRGSLLETKSQLIYGERVGYFSKEDVNNLLELHSSIHLEFNKTLTQPQS